MERKGGTEVQTLFANINAHLLYNIILQQTLISLQSKHLLSD